MARHKRGALLWADRVRPHHPPPTFSPTHLSVGFAAWVDSPVVWTLPACAAESGFLLEAKSASLFSALTTEPVRCVLGETQNCQVTCVAQPFLEYWRFLLSRLLLGSPVKACVLVLCRKALPPSDPSALAGPPGESLKLDPERLPSGGS